MTNKVKLSIVITLKKLNKGKLMETRVRKARSLTGKPYDSSAAKRILCGRFVFWRDRDEIE